MTTFTFTTDPVDSDSVQVCIDDHLVLAIERCPGRVIVSAVPITKGELWEEPIDSMTIRDDKIAAVESDMEQAEAENDDANEV
jgi:hypothetical protein